MSERIVPLSGRAAAEWAMFRAALCVAAKPFTGKDELALSPFYGHEIPRLDREIDAALKDAPTGSHAAFDLNGGTLCIVVTMP